MRRRGHDHTRPARDRGPWRTSTDRRPLRGDGGSCGLEEIRWEIADAVRAGATLEEIERGVIDRAVIDDEQRSALWLYAEAVIDQPGRLLWLSDDFALAGSPHARSI